MSDMQSMFEGRGTSFVRRLGPRLSSAAVKGLAAAVSLIVLVAAVVAVVVLNGSVKWLLLGGIFVAGLVSGAYQFGTSHSSDRHENIDADSEGGLLNQIPSHARLNVEGFSRAPTELYDLSTEAKEAEYYGILAESIRGSGTVIYRSGRGFTDEPLNRFSRDLVSAEEFALKQGVKIHRIQTSDHEGYQKLSNMGFADPRLIVTKSSNFGPARLKGNGSSHRVERRCNQNLNRWRSRCVTIVPSG